MGENNIILGEEKIPVSHCFGSNFFQMTWKKGKNKKQGAN
jgi:hypothetical protein